MILDTLFMNELFGNFEFELIITESCSDGSFGASTGEQDQTYYLGTASGTYEIEEFSINAGVSACTIVYAVDIAMNDINQDSSWLVAETRGITWP